MDRDWKGEVFWVLGKERCFGCQCGGWYLEVRRFWMGRRERGRERFDTGFVSRGAIRFFCRIDWRL